MDPYDILVEAESRLVALVKSLEPGDLARPTPCGGWDVRTLLSHTVAGIEIFASTIDGADAPTAADMFGGRDLLGHDPVAATLHAVTRSQAAWGALDDPEREVATILGPLPAAQMLAITAFATVVHGWDLAVAIDQEITELPDELLAHARAVAAEHVPVLRAGDDHSLFLPEVPAPADATPTQELMAFLGRTPVPTTPR